MEDVGSEGIGFSLCAVPLGRLSPHISEEQRNDRQSDGGDWSRGKLEELLRIKQRSKMRMSPS